MCCPCSTKLLPTSLICAVLRENASLLRSGPWDLRIRMFVETLKKWFQHQERTPQFHLASSFPSCFYNSSVGRDRAQAGLFRRGGWVREQLVCPLVFFIPPEVKQEYKQWIGKVNLPESYERKGCRIKDTAERGSRRGWDSRDPARRNNAQDGASSRTFLERFWTFLQPQETKIRRSRSALGSLEGAGHIGTRYLFSFSEEPGELL